MQLPRPALLCSLALHTGIVAWSALTARPSQITGGDGTISVLLGGAEGGGLLSEEAPAEPPAAAEAPFESTPPPLPAPAPDVAREIAEVPTKLPDPRPMQPPVVESTEGLVGAVQPTASVPPTKRAASRGAAGEKRAHAMSGSAPGTAGARGGGGLTLGGGRLGFVPPHYLLRYKPLYPPEARAQRLEGTAIVLVFVDATGRVLSATLQRTSGYALLDHAALQAVETWRFAPATQDGFAVAANVELPVSFRFLK